MTFRYWGDEYELFDHPYNTTALNERAVEVPIALDFMARQQTKERGLEVGNVLSHYAGLAVDDWTLQRRIVDLYEEGDGVENVDVFSIEGIYDWIVSISTLEHVRWDCDPVDAGASADALEHLLGCLAPGGAMLVTVPTGHHPLFDIVLASGAGARRACTMRRDGDGWSQTDEPVFLPYGATTEWAEAVWIGEW